MYCKNIIFLFIISNLIGCIPSSSYLNVLLVLESESRTFESKISSVLSKALMSLSDKLTQASEFNKREDKSKLDLKTIATSKKYFTNNTESNICLICVMTLRPFFFFLPIHFYCAFHQLKDRAFLA